MPLVNARNAFHILLTFSLILLAGCEPDKEDQTKSLAPTLSRAQAYVNQGQYKAAIIEAKNALRIAPKSDEAISLAARINIDLGQSNSAYKLLEPLKDSNNPEIRLLLAEAYLMRGKYRSSLNYLHKPYTAQPPIDEQQKLISAQIDFKANLSLDNYSDAASALEKIQKLSTSNSDKADFNYLKATLLFRQNKIEKASEYLEEALSINNEHVDALLMKSAIAFSKNNLEQSEETLTTALLALGETDVLLPKKVKVLNVLIDVLSSQGRSSEAFIYTKLLSQHNPRANEIKSKLKEAVELYTSGDYEQAESMLLDINNKTPNAKSRQLLGLLSIKKGNMEDAESYLSEGFDPEVANTKSISLLARTQLQLKQPEKVVAMLREEVKVRENDPEILALYGLASLASGNETAGIKALTRAIDISPQRHRLRIALADYYESNKQTALALEHLEKAYDGYPDSIDIQQRLLKQYLSSEKAVTDTAFYRALKTSPNDSRLNFLVGAIQLQSGKKKEAEAKFQKAIDSDSKNVDALYALALTKLSGKDSKEAEALFSKIISLSPNNPQGYKGLTQAKIQQGMGDKIEGLMLSLSEKHPSSSGPLEVLSELHLKKGDLEKALFYAKLSLERNPTLISSRNQVLKALSIRARRHFANNKLSLARAEIIEALKVSPNSLMFLSELVKVELKDNKVQEAKKLASQIEQLAPKTPLSFAINSDVAAAEGMPDIAMKFIRKAWELLKTDAIGRKHFIILAQSDKPQALSFLDEWSTAIPNSPEPLRRKGTLALQDNKYAEAISLFEQAIKLYPKDIVSLNNLAWLYQKQGDVRAANTAKKAHDLAPLNASVKDTYGWILSQQGDKAEAVKLLQEAVKLAPDNKEIQQHLTQAMQR